MMMRALLQHSILASDKMKGNLGIKERDVSIDILRIIACLGVIVGHTAGGPIYNSWVEKGSNEYAMYVIMGALIRWAVPSFVLITGFFFLNPQKEMPLKKLYSKHILRIVISQVFWTLFYAVTLHWRYYPFGGQDNHFWYIGMLIGLYISMPVLRLIATNNKILSYSCWIWLFVQCYFFIARFIEIPLVFTDFVYTDYVGYCLWGWYITQMKLKDWHKKLIYLLGFIGLTTSVFAPLMFDVSLTAPETPTSICASIALILFFIEHPITVSNKVKKKIFDLSKSTFGIYMVHIFILTELHSRIYRYVQQPVLWTMLTVGVTFVVSYGIIWLIKRIPIVGKWVV